MLSSNRHVAMAVLVTFTGNMLVNGCTATHYGTTGQSLTAEATACADDADAKLKRKLELRKITLEAKIDTAESKIKVNDMVITEDSGTIEANTKYIKLLQDGLNYPPTDPAQPSAPGKKQLLDIMDDVGKFPASSVFKFGLYTLMAALEAITLRAGGKLVARKLCLQTAVKQAEKVAVAEATKLASSRALAMFTKFRSAFGRVRMVVQHTGSIGLPMKVKWDQKGNSWETWVPVIGTLKIGADNVADEFSVWINSDEVKKNLQAQVDLIDAAQKTAQDEIKAAATDKATREKENVQLTDDIKAMKIELAKVNAALAKLGGNACAAPCDEGSGSDVVTTTGSGSGSADTGSGSGSADLGSGSGDLVVVSTAVARVFSPTAMGSDGVPTATGSGSTDPTTADDPTTGAGSGSDPTAGTGSGSDPTAGTGSGSDPVDDPPVDYDSWTLDELLAGITLDDGDAGDGEADALIRDQFEECDLDNAPDQCAALD